MQKWIILIIVCLIVILGTVIVVNSKVEVEYIPEEEIDDVNFRNTNIKLYFQNKETKEIECQNKTIDSKELLFEPYKKIVEYLISGPEGEILERCINENTKINDIYLSGNIVVIDFSEDFLNSKSNAEETIKKTLTEFFEVDDIKILINGIINKEM